MGPKSSRQRLIQLIPTIPTTNSDDSLHILNDSLEDLTPFSHWIPPISRSTELLDCQSASGLRGIFKRLKS